MEIKEITKKLAKYRSQIIIFIILGAVLGVGIYFLPPKYISSGSFYIKRSISGEKNYFTYEGYYGQQTALSYTNSVIALAESLDIKRLVLDKLKIEVNEESLRKLSRMIRVKKTGSQIILITVKADSYATSENIWNKLSESLLSTTYEINKDGDPNLMVEKVSDRPVVKEGYRSILLFGIGGSLISFTIFSFYICFKEYLKD
jgi:capsular polysaccharide biosynthesis protein